MSKDELVRALLRVARAKPGSAVRLTRSLKTERARTASSPRRSRSTPGRKPHLNGHASALMRGRDLCTTEVPEPTSAGHANCLDATVSDAHWIRAVWDLTRDSIRRAETRLAADWHRAVPVLRLLAVAAQDGTPAADVFVKDVLIEAGVNAWYVNVPAHVKACRLHIGYRTAKGVFFAVAKSNVCVMPAPARSVGEKPGLAPRDGAHDLSFGHARSASSSNSDERLGRPLGFSSLSHFGPAASIARQQGEFIFQLETELIVHGQTRPGSCLTVHGEPIELRDDGSFTIRTKQPEGRQVIAFTALNPRGSERRMVVLGVERNTKELERQYFDGGHPEGTAD